MGTKAPYTYMLAHSIKRKHMISKQKQIISKQKQIISKQKHIIFEQNIYSEYSELRLPKKNPPGPCDLSRLGYSPSLSSFGRRCLYKNRLCDTDIDGVVQISIV